MEPSAPGYFVPIACRFVPHDRWLVTHLHTSWKITDAKLWLLAKYFPALFTHAPSIPRQRLSQRRVSPIKFAKREEVSDDEQIPADVAYGDTDYFGALPGVDDDDPILSDKYKYVPRISPGASLSDIIPKASASSPYADPSNFVLLSYSTTQILEDGWRFGWYTMHPHELLELHTYPYIAKLPRSSVFGYCQPYFESSAWVLRLIDDFGSGTRAADGSGRLGEILDVDKDRTRKRKKLAQWHQRWIVIREGYFHIYKDRNESNWQYRVEISSMVAIRGINYLKEVRLTTIDHYPGPKQDFNENRILCVKFRHQPQQVDNSNWFRRGSRDASASDESRQGRTADHGHLDDEADDPWAGDTAIFFLLMHDDTAFPGSFTGTAIPARPASSHTSEYAIILPTDADDRIPHLLLRIHPPVRLNRTEHPLHQLLPRPQSDTPSGGSTSSVKRGVLAWAMSDARWNSLVSETTKTSTTLPLTTRTICPMKHNSVVAR
ncbi:hypothetical protein PHLGIDRAFT_288740 [Phlebiopsis gigantea 11061_1 CR5-6]|uniref:PH domain-containing protein n=1 Tax=Phlebiopsis gigantea (strain 11061_1 CR5-6) TaxID=745531 RepID=A0A0C3SDT9_PHLG1|nr:hypothetical protein PHLGIDRAFT_288740 [Phlebiopsis gigantea 11061_1 CR5-6]